MGLAGVISMFRVKRMPGALPDGALSQLAGVRIVARAIVRGAASAPSPGRDLAKIGGMLVERAW